MSSGGALFELEDQAWFPGYLRRMQTEYIGWLAMVLKAYRPLVPILIEALNGSGTRRVVDLGSGNGGPIKDLATAPGTDRIEFLLTDVFPSPAPLRHANITWYEGSVDARADLDLEGIRTMFNAYHHFGEAEKQAIVRIHGGHGLLVAELLRPDPFCFLQVLLITTIGQVLLCPFVRPFRWDRLLFTWLIPINLFTVAWDGLVSVIRVDRQKMMEDRAREFAPPGSVVKGGMAGPWWSRVAWFVVIPLRT